MFISAGVEFPNPHDPIHNAAARHKTESRKLFESLALQAGLERVEPFADVYMMLMEVLVMRQLHGRNAAAPAEWAGPIRPSRDLCCVWQRR
ncbi:MAG: hypothetical protein ACLFUJ_01465 [Phycisphaerae bacterium]